jgi:DNA-binding GntR family transcriptional regulator
MNSGLPTLLSGSQPRYLVLAQTLVDDISSGRYPLDSLLPTEFELCEQFKVSRSTVREAIRRLSELGLVAKQQGVGSRVTATQVPQHYVQVSEGICDLHQYVQDVRLEIGHSEEVITDAALAGLLECAQGERWLKITGLRHRAGDSVPLARTEVFIPHAYRGVLENLDDGLTPLYDLLQRRYQLEVNEVRQDISAVAISAEEAQVLNVDAGSPGLCVVRKYFAHGQLLEVAVNVHPGTRFSYSVTQRLKSQGDT